MLVSCGGKKNDNKRAHYFAIDSLIEKQIKLLPSMKAALAKTVSFKKKTNQIKITSSDTLFWSKELSVFSVIDDMNRPNNRGSYEVEDGLSDTQSNLKVKLFSSTADQKVSWLKLYYHNSLSNLKKIEASISEENGLYGTDALYKSSRLLTMEFQNLNNKTLLTSYSVVGGQKMFSADTAQYSVRGEIKIY
jgi:hypothetical protein